ncbi:MAG: glycosyltransferase family 2 protein [Betaproteobacteria bacterium]|nr:glycosyltransferase family 2 protein [Betaproteobacteria bacterium]
MPKVSIGLPVYNGAEFLTEALDSLIGQSFEDFELIISDNASTDQTEAICRDFAARDQRIRYLRLPGNLGGSANFNRVVELSSGIYFKWAAHDDVCEPDFLRKCIAVLDEDSHVVLCYPRTVDIDSTGQERKRWGPRKDFASHNPHIRFRESLSPEETLPIWGVIRTEVLKKTSLIGGYPASDRPLLAELALHGRFHEIPEVLFLHREHKRRSVRLYDFRDPYRAVVWYDPGKAGRIIFPTWRLLRGYSTAIRRASLRWIDRFRCRLELIGWMRRQRVPLSCDLLEVGKRLPLIGRAVQVGCERAAKGSWKRKVRRAENDIRLVVPEDETIILVDENSFNVDQVDGRACLPFLEQEGQYWGLPPDSATAIRELERLRRRGTHFIAFAWSCFWWFDFYEEFHDYLRARYPCVLANRRLVVFDLRDPLQREANGESIQDRSPMKKKPVDHDNGLERPVVR